MPDLSMTYRYVTELAEEGFDVSASEDTSFDNVIIRVKKDGVTFCESVKRYIYLDDVCLKQVVRKLVNKVENTLKEKTNA